MDWESQSPVLLHPSQDASKGSPDARIQRAGSRATNPSLARFIRHSTGECPLCSFVNPLIILATDVVCISHFYLGSAITNSRGGCNDHLLSDCNPRNTFRFATSSFISFPFGVSRHAG